MAAKKTSKTRKPARKRVAAKSKLNGKGKAGAKPAKSGRAKAGPAKARPAKSKPAKARSTAAASEKARLAANKKLVLTMYQFLIGEKDFDKARPYLGDTYRQHAPYARDGHDGVRDWVKGFKEAFPNHRFEVKKVIAEGDFVVLHLHGMNGPNPHGESVVDFFRVENGKVVEHWDVIQAIPDTADNANSMF